MSSHSMIFISKDVCQTSFVPAPVHALKQDPYLFTKKKKKKSNHERKLKMQGVAVALPHSSQGCILQLQSVGALC